MGSGCNSNNSQYFGKRISDEGVYYTGEAIPSLGICTNDLLSEIEAILLNKILEFSTGTGINVEDIDFSSCTFIDSFIADKDLTTILQGLIEATCSLKTTTESIQADVLAKTNLNLDPKCLTFTSVTIQNVFQTLINKVCSIQTDLTALTSTVNSLVTNQTTTITNIVNDAIGDYLVNHVFSTGGNSIGIYKDTSGPDPVLYIDALVPPWTPLPYIGPMTYFDSTGRGTGRMTGWYVMNGQNGTQDWRGYTFSGATNVVGGTLDSRVNPSALPYGDVATNINDKKGHYKSYLDIPNLPPHAHGGATLGDGAHLHVDPVSGGNLQVRSTTSGGIIIAGGTTGWKINDSITPTGQHNHGIAVEGEYEAHENRQPTVYGVWIVRLY